MVQKQYHSDVGYLKQYAKFLFKQIDSSYQDGSITIFGDGVVSVEFHGGPYGYHFHTGDNFTDYFPFKNLSLSTRYSSIRLIKHSGGLFLTKISKCDSFEYEDETDLNTKFSKVMEITE